ncbi:hypothetical protein [Natronomonas sp.]|uniref:hypothetical protein n=1 Tax=Natronomonas sp. TaxID=2184060 RepID=UPI0039753737
MRPADGVDVPVGRRWVDPPRLEPSVDLVDDCPDERPALPERRRGLGVLGLEPTQRGFAAARGWYSTPDIRLEPFVDRLRLRT